MWLRGQVGGDHSAVFGGAAGSPWHRYVFTRSSSNNRFQPASLRFHRLSPQMLWASLAAPVEEVLLGNCGAIAAETAWNWEDELMRESLKYSAVNALNFNQNFDAQNQDLYQSTYTPYPWIGHSIPASAAACPNLAVFATFSPQLAADLRPAAGRRYAGFAVRDFGEMGINGPNAIACGVYAWGVISRGTRLWRCGGGHDAMGQARA